MIETFKFYNWKRMQNFLFYWQFHTLGQFTFDFEERIFLYLGQVKKETCLASPPSSFLEIFEISFYFVNFCS